MERRTERLLDRAWSDLRPAAVALAGTALVGGLLWHARPILIWHYTVAPEIERTGRGARLHVPTLRDLPPPEADWPVVRGGGLVLRAPVRGEGAPICPGREICFVDLVEGRLVFLDGRLPRTWSDAIAAYAPSPEDLSLLRPPRINWRTLESLASRALGPSPPPEALRFVGPASRGIVTRFRHPGPERSVAYVYDHRGRPLGSVAFTRARFEVLMRILGSLAVESPAPSGGGGA